MKTFKLAKCLFHLILALVVVGSTESFFFELSEDGVIWLTNICKPIGGWIVTRPFFCLFLNIQSVTPTKMPTKENKNPTEPESIENFNFNSVLLNAIQAQSVSLNNAEATKDHLQFGEASLVTKSDKTDSSTISPSSSSFSAISEDLITTTLPTLIKETTLELEAAFSSTIKEDEATTKTATTTEKTLPMLPDSILESLFHSPMMSSSQEVYVCVPAREIECDAGAFCPLTYDFRRKRVLPAKMCDFEEQKCKGYFLCERNSMGEMECPKSNYTKKSFSKCLKLEEQYI